MTTPTPTTMRTTIPATTTMLATDLDLALLFVEELIEGTQLIDRSEDYDGREENDEYRLGLRRLEVLLNKLARLEAAIDSRKAQRAVELLEKERAWALHLQNIMQEGPGTHVLRKTLSEQLEGYDLALEQLRAVLSMHGGSDG